MANRYLRVCTFIDPFIEYILIPPDSLLITLDVEIIVYQHYARKGFGINHRKI